MVTMTNDYPRIESEGFVPLLHYTKKSNLRDCGNCKNELSDWDRVQDMKRQVKEGVKREELDYNYCSLLRKNKECKFQLK